MLINRDNSRDMCARFEANVNCGHNLKRSVVTRKFLFRQKLFLTLESFLLVLLSNGPCVVVVDLNARVLLRRGRKNACVFIAFHKWKGSGEN